MFLEDELTWRNIEKHIYKKHHVTKNMYYHEWRIYANIYKRISVQYHKNVTSNISVHESSQNTMEIDKAISEVPVEITNKLSKMPLENATWYSDFEKGYTTAPTITPVEKTTDVSLTTSKVEDDTSGRKKIFKNFIYNTFVYKYQVWDM